MSEIILYGNNFSPPVRACLLTLKAIKLPFKFEVVSLAKLEHLKPEFLQHNPQHTIPVLLDNGNWLWDSHAICAYLVSKYAKTDSLYPKDLIQRARVDQRLYFDASILFMALRNISAPLFRQCVSIISKEKSANIIEGYDFMDKFLANNLYIAGNELTIADFCCCATITSLNGMVQIDKKKFQNIHAWLARMEALDYYVEANGVGNQNYVDLIKSKITEIIL